MDLTSLQGRLLAGAVEWARGGVPDDELSEIRTSALRLRHRQYLEYVPLYASVARSEGVGAEAELPEIVQSLLFRDLFKSYDATALEAGDFQYMTEWLGEASTLRPRWESATTVSEWRQELRRQEVHVMFSTGTSGKMSFVPRDAATWKAWRSHSALYARGGWAGRTTRQGEGFDLLVAGPKGGGMGILGAGVGLARMATRAHFLQDRSMEDEAVAAAGRSGPGSPSGHARPTAEEYEAAARFVATASEAGRPLVVFGAPFQIQWLCEAFLQRSTKVQAPAESMLVTGGGWKSFAGERIPRHELHTRVEGSLGILREQCVDTFGSTELNCVFSTCPEDRYHIPPLLEPLVLDDAFMGRPGTEGWGHLAFLDPFAGSYPGFVITGDQGLLRWDDCRCGLTGWFIEGEIQRPQGAEIRGCGGVLASAVM